MAGGTGWIAATNGAVALAAATPKTVLNVIAAANRDVIITEIGVGFDGVTASAVPVLIELCQSTQAGAGTSSAVTVIARNVNDATTAAATAAKNYSGEPTVLTTIREWLLTPNGGLLVMQFPLAREPASGIAKGLAIRCTAPAIVNVRAYIEYEE